MLRLSGVGAGYQGGDVLRDVDLVVPPGSSVALLGANGAGKTTLLRVAAGVPPKLRRGHVELLEQRIDHVPPHDRARLGLCLIPEGRGIFRKLTVRENVTVFAGGATNRTRMDARADRALETVLRTFPRLEPFVDTGAGQLSGGQQQMLALGRALVTDARVVLADELSVGLAPIVVDEIFAALRRLRAEGRALLIVEQYVDRILDVVDHVYILHKGRIVFAGQPDECRSSATFDRYLGRHHSPPGPNERSTS
jgi:branched-chain amino acid transport system ATP-binding protein